MEKIFNRERAPVVKERSVRKLVAVMNTTERKQGNEKVFWHAENYYQRPTLESKIGLM